MAKRKDIDAASPDGTPEPALPKSETPHSVLPNVESPSISPATPEPAIESKIEPAAEIASPVEPVAVETPAVVAVPETPAAPATARLFVLRPRHKRYALLAASVAIAAALGAVLGAVASGGLRTPLPRTDVAGAEERKSMQQSIARLAKDVTALKSNLDVANKAAHTQIAKIGERLNRESAEITGSISPPQTAAPVPVPRPAPHIAALETQNTARPPVVQGWTIRDTRDGFVYVQGHGDVYQVVPGAPLPGLGPVQSVKRQDGRWMVLTPKGIIVSMRDRRYFE